MNLLGNSARHSGGDAVLVRAMPLQDRIMVRVVDRGRADQFLGAVRPLPAGERAIVAMGVAALATHAISRRGRLIKAPTE